MADVFSGEIKCRQSLFRWRSRTRHAMMATEARYHYIIKYSLIRFESMFAARQRQQNIIASTRKFYKRKLLSTTVHGWRARVEKRKVLAAAYQELHSHLNRNNVRRHVRFWREERHRSLDRKCLLSIAFSTGIAERFVLHGAVRTWRVNTALQKIESTFELSKTNTVLHRVLKSWKVKTQHAITADKFALSSQLRRGISKWTRRLERREDRKIDIPLRIARDFYAKRTLAKSISQWQCFILEHEALSSVLGKCDQFYKVTQIGKALTNWQGAYKNRVYQKDLAKTADTFRSNILKSQVCYFIWRESDRRIRLSADVDSALDFYKNQMFRKTLSQWKVSYSDQLAQNLRQARIVKFYRTKLLLKSISAFVTHVESVRASIENSAIAEQFHAAYSLSAAFHAWRKITRDGICHRRVRGALDRHVLKQSFSKWNQLRIDQSRRVQISTHFCETKTTRRMKGIVQQWKNRAHTVRTERELHETREIDANQFCIHRRLLKCSRRIMHVINVIKYHQNRQERLFQSAVEKVEDIRYKKSVSIALHHWADMYHQRGHIRRMNALAVQHDRAGKIKRIHRRFCITLARFSIQIQNGRVSDQFVKLALTRSTLSRWKTRLRDKRLESEQTGIALNFLYETKTWKVVQEWKQWHARKKEKNKYYEEAFRIHRQTVEQDWCVQLDQWATKFTNERKRIARRNCGQRYVYLARKVLARWRLLVRGRPCTDQPRIMFIPKILPSDLSVKKELIFRAPKIPSFLTCQLEVQKRNDSTQPTSTLIQSDDAITVEVLSDVKSETESECAFHEDAIQEPIQKPIHKEPVTSSPEICPLYFLDESKVQATTHVSAHGDGYILSPFELSDLFTKPCPKMYFIEESKFTPIQPSAAADSWILSESAGSLSPEDIMEDVSYLDSEEELKQFCPADWSSPEEIRQRCESATSDNDSATSIPENVDDVLEQIQELVTLKNRLSCEGTWLCIPCLSHMDK